MEKCCTAGQATDDNMAHAGHLRLQTHSQYVIIVFPLQQWLHERTSMLRYMYTACLVINLNCKALKYSCRAPYST